MIFVTVGEQLPFDRLIRIVDEWAKNTGGEVFAQIGRTSFKPQNIKYKNFLHPNEFKKKFEYSDLVISHAGMGTIITAIEIGKPIIVIPRQASLGEHRNDHQFSTAKRFMNLNYITVAFDENELMEKLKYEDDLVKFKGRGKDSGPSKLLIEHIRNFISI